MLAWKEKNKVHYYEFPIIKEIKRRNGAISKCDIPQFFNDMPEEFPVIWTIKEVATIKNYLIQLKNNRNHDSKNYKNNVNKINLLEEPIPNHTFCHICKKSFDNYIVHINDKMHKDNSQKYSNIYNNINTAFKRVNEFWKNENNRNTQTKEIINQNELIIILMKKILKVLKKDSKYFLNLIKIHMKEVKQRKK